MNINIIGMPLFYGSDIWGVNNGPNKLREAGIKEILSKYNPVFDMGNIYVASCDSREKYYYSEKAKYLKEIVDSNINLANNVYLALKNESFPFTIGGDHSLALGTIAGTAKYYEDNLAIIWIDAHGDFNNLETTPSGNIHGMPLAASAGIGINRLTDIYFNGPKIKSENIFIIGARDLDEGEKVLLKENNVNVWTTNDVKKLGEEKIIKSILSKLNNKDIQNIHISFDIDSISPEYMPGTGTPVKDGLSLDNVINILKGLFNSKKVKALDLVEFNPELDNDDVTLKNCINIVKEISNLINVEE